MRNDNQDPGGASRIMWGVVVLSYKRRYPLGAIIEQHPTLLTNTTTSKMPLVLGCANSYLFITPKGDEVLQVRRGVPQLDSLGDEYLSGQQVGFRDFGLVVSLLTPFGIDLRSGQ